MHYNFQLEQTFRSEDNTSLTAGYILEKIRKGLFLLTQVKLGTPDLVSLK